MMMRRVLSTTVLLLGLSVAAAHAEILATGVLYSDPNQSSADCFLANAGTGSVTVTSGQIIAESGVPISLSFLNNCGVLTSGHTCGIAGPISNTGYYCKFVITPSASDVRGDFHIRETGGTFGITSVHADLR